jgi:hypothetical protein
MRNRNKNWNNAWRKSFSSSTKSSRSIRKSASSAVDQEGVKGYNNYAYESKELGGKPPKQNQNQDSEGQLHYNTLNPYAGYDVRNLPRHLYRPFNAQSVDLRNLLELDAGATARVLEFECPKSSSVVFTGYGVFSDAFLEQDIEFLPKVNGKRIFPYHGNPGNNFKIALGLAPDLANSALIECYLLLRPGDVLTWDIVSSSAVTLSAGVRMKGYLDAANLQIEQQFGG